MELTFLDILPYIYLGGIIASWAELVRNVWQPTITGVGVSLFMALLWPISLIVAIYRLFGLEQ